MDASSTTVEQEAPETTVRDEAVVERGAGPRGPIRGRDMSAVRVDRQKGGMWLWLLQRITAAYLIFGLLVHLIATHIFSIGELSYDNVAHRLASVFFIVVDVLLLAASIFHALNGSRMVLLDYTFKSRGPRRILDWSLFVVGLGVMGYGTWALWPWIAH